MAKKWNTFLTGLIAMLAVGAIFAGTASANTDDLTVVSASANSSVKVKVKYRYIGTWVKSTHPLKKKHGHPRCFWRSGTWTNSVLINGRVRAYRETSRAKFCWLRRPVKVGGTTFTAVKVAGGKTGMPCDNLAVPPGRRQPKPKIKGPVLDVESLSNVSIKVGVFAQAKADVAAMRVCADSILYGSASGSATARGKTKVFISQELILRSHGRVNGSIRSAVRQQIRVQIETEAKANAKANVKIKCGQAPPPPPPNQPPPPTVVPPTAANVTQPQEVYVNETYPNVCADVSAPAGHSVKVVFSAVYGNFPNSTFNYSGGLAHPCKTYNAPGDVTPTGTDTITVTVYDITTGLHASASSRPFDVWKNPPVCC